MSQQLQNRMYKHTLILYICMFLPAYRYKAVQLLLFFTQEHVISSHDLPQTHQYIDMFKGKLQCENNLISYERAFKMLENDRYIAGIGQAISSY